VGYDRHRILSGLVAAYLIGLAVYSGDPGSIIWTLSVLIWPIAMIWWPDVLGSLTGIRLGMVNQASAGWAVRSFGWVLLVSIVLVVVWYFPYLESLAP
jgi:hypothetical protein